MRIRDLRDLSADELRTKETELREQLFKLRFQKSLGQLDSPMKLRTIKRDIARIRTVLHEMAEKAA
ncbi:MAG: 50S ribosomal protein L29 [Candidatus Aminicenantes bacterium]|nr:50S ribosomal protein L29 [Candidatus Aminicenantes bacterium]